MAGDWVKLHRSLMQHPTFQHDGLYRLWSFCIMRANWKESTWMIPGTLSPIIIPRGSFITGRESLWTQLYGHEYRGDHKPSSRTVWRWLETLESLGCIVSNTLSNRATMVTICNYETYQQQDEPECPAGVPPVSNSCPAGVPPVSTNKEGKEYKEGNNGSASHPGFSHGFQMAWDSWPAHRRTKKEAARAGWDAAIARIAFRFEGSTARSEEWLLDRVRAYAKSPKAAGKFCSGIAGWLVDGDYDASEESWQESDGQAVTNTAPRAKDTKPPPKRVPKADIYGMGPEAANA